MMMDSYLSLKDLKYNLSVWSTIGVHQSPKMFTERNDPAMQSASYFMNSDSLTSIKAILYPSYWGIPVN